MLNDHVVEFLDFLRLYFMLTGVTLVIVFQKFHSQVVS